VWRQILAGASGAGPIQGFDATGFPVTFAAEVKNFDPLQFVDKKEARKMGRFTHFAFAAVAEAMAQSGLQITEDIADRVGVFIGSGIGGFEIIEREHNNLLQGGPRKMSPFFIPAAIVNMAAGNISIRYGARGPISATATACATSANSIGDSVRMILHGDADAMIAGGSEAADHGRGRIRRHARAFHAQRRAYSRQPSLRQGSRRIRDRRGRRHSHS
jgi:3-oxoacyl-[acyl-carrier-protein] synthase II